MHSESNSGTLERRPRAGDGLRYRGCTGVSAFSYGILADSGYLEGGPIMWYTSDGASLNPRFFWAFLLIVILLVVVTGHCQTRVRQFPEMTIVRRGNFVIGATTDGYLCYGTRTPLATSCHRAVPEVAYAGE
jgi:hypothetical protein